MECVHKLTNETNDTRNEQIHETNDTRNERTNYTNETQTKNERTIHANETNEKRKRYEISANLNDPGSVYRTVTIITKTKSIQFRMIIFDLFIPLS